MTDQRERVSTDPGIGPVGPDNTATLRSIQAAVEVEPDGASMYCEPVPLVAVSDHRTLEMETVKLAKDIDPRRVQTELSLPRSPPPPQYDSGWPQAEVVLTSSHRPAPPRRWRVPLVLFAVLGGLLLIVLARSVARHSSDQKAASAALRVEAVALPAPSPVAKAAAAAAREPALLPAPAASTAQPPASAHSAASTAANADPAASARPTANANPPAKVRAASHVQTRASAIPHPTASKAGPELKASPEPSASGSALSSAAKPKRAIY